MSADLKTVLDFLLHLFNKDLSYSCVNTARSALSSYIFVDGKPVGEHPLVVRFLKGIFNKRPSLPRYSRIWDVSIVLQKLSKIHPAKKLTLKQLTLKVVTLAALITGQRVQTLHLLHLENLSKTDHCYEFVITENVKTSRPGRHIDQLSLRCSKSRKVCVL